MERQVTKTKTTRRRDEMSAYGGHFVPSAGVERLAELIRGSRSIVALTGAGVSVPSGIPDFRTPETGLWANVDPMEVAHIDVFERDPARFWSYYRPRFHSLGAFGAAAACSTA
jgi:NAD-dependent SIR2 family protein deacetylase